MYTDQKITVYDKIYELWLFTRNSSTPWPTALRIFVSSSEFFGKPKSSQEMFGRGKTLRKYDSCCKISVLAELRVILARPLQKRFIVSRQECRKYWQDMIGHDWILQGSMLLRWPYQTHGWLTHPGSLTTSRVSHISVSHVLRITGKSCFQYEQEPR